MESEVIRELIRVVTIDDVVSIPKADRIELAFIGGWQCVVRKGEIKKGDRVIYCEIDSLLPITHPWFAFMEERKECVKLVNDLPYGRVKTITLRKELSQGLVIPFPEGLTEADVIAEIPKIGVLHYSANKRKQASFDGESDEIVTWFQRVAHWIKGPDENINRPFPDFLKESGAKRVQNIPNAYQRARASGETFQRTVKLDGSSMTVYSIPLPQESGNPTISFKNGLCTHHTELVMYDTVWPFFRQLRYWIGSMLLANRRMLTKRHFVIVGWKRGAIASSDKMVTYVQQHCMHRALMERCLELGHAIALQGEMVGPGYRKNYEGLSKPQFRVFAVFRIDDGIPLRLSPARARQVLDRKLYEAGVFHVPILEAEALLPDTIAECLKAADGPRSLVGDIPDKGFREGVVYQSNHRDFSFKVISNTFLIVVEDEDEDETVQSS